MMRNVLALLAVLWSLALAQQYRGLALGTAYPEIGVQPGESVSLTLTLKSYGLPPGVVRLSVPEVPAGWQAVLTGGGRLVRAVYLNPDQEASLTLRLQPPKEVKEGTYRFLVRAEGLGQTASLPITLMVGQGLPNGFPSRRSSPSSKAPHELLPLPGDP